MEWNNNGFISKVMLEEEAGEYSSRKRVVAFTFDDGPNPVYTPQLLEIFRSVNGKATFFMIGQQIDAHPETAELVHVEGHEIANHTFAHPYLTRLTVDEVRSELERTDKRIRAITGKPVQSFRPPYLDVNYDILSSAAEFGYRSISAVNLETRDWEQPGIEHILEKTRGVVSNGSILLFHDGSGDRSQTIEAVRILVAELAAKGYRFVTVTELLALADTQYPQADEIRTLYHKLLEAWNNRNARAMADVFAKDGEMIGFDGSQSIGREEIYLHVSPIFEHHPTAKFVSKVKNIRFYNSNIAILRAIAGMVPPGKSDINPNVNTHHTLAAVKIDGEWRVQLFQNTPAQFHGRPALVEQMTNELREML